MSNPDTPRHVEVKDGDQTVAAAEVTTAEGAEGTARTSLLDASVPPETGQEPDRDVTDS
jgi:hypothetical protein